MSTIYKITDDMDAASMAELRPDLEMLANNETDVELDLSCVTFMDSSGVGGVVFLYKRLMAAGHRLTVRGIKGQPLQMLNYLHLTDLLAPKLTQAA